MTLIHFNYSSSSRSAVLVSFLKSNLSYLTFRLQNNLVKKYGTRSVLLSYFTHRCPSVESNCFVLNSFADLRTLYAASYDSDRVVLYNSTTGLTYTLPGKRNEHPGDGMSFICFILLLSPGISFLLFLRTQMRPFTYRDKIIALVILVVGFQSLNLFNQNRSYSIPRFNFLQT